MSWFLVFLGLGLLLAAVIIVAGLAVGWLVSRYLAGRAGGWRRMARLYETDRCSSRFASRGETLQVGHVVYKRCVVLDPLPEGLFLEVRSGFCRRPALLIPWEDITRVQPTRLFWGRAMLLTVGDPPVATITLPGRLYDAVEAYLDVVVPAC